MYDSDSVGGSLIKKTLESSKAWQYYCCKAIVCFDVFEVFSFYSHKVATYLDSENDNGRFRKRIICEIINSLG